MKNTLVLFAHPYLEHSRSNREIIKFYGKYDHLDFRDLYEDYHDFHIAAFRERKRLANYERIIFHFPLIWFGMPPLLKLWIDEVFDRHWIQKNEKNPLDNLDAVILITAEGDEESYSKNGKFHHTIEELMSGLVVCLELNNIKLKKIKCIYNADRISKKEIVLQKQQFQKILEE